MKYPKYLFLWLLAMVTCACMPPKEGEKQVEEQDPFKRVVSLHAEKQLKRYQLQLVACENTPTHSVDKTFALHYITDKSLKLADARKLLVLSIQEFLSLANNDEKLRLKLDHYPLTVEDLHFNLGFVNMYGEFYEAPHVSYIYLDDGKICYCYYDNLFATFTDNEEIEESYDRALEIVKGVQKP